MWQEGRFEAMRRSDARCEAVRELRAMRARGEGHGLGGQDEASGGGGEGWGRKLADAMSVYVGWGVVRGGGAGAVVRGCAGEGGAGG